MDTNALEHLLTKARATHDLPGPDRRREIRERRGLSQEDLAEVLGVTGAAVSRWETGARQPAGQHLVDYCELLQALDQLASTS